MPKEYWIVRCRDLKDKDGKSVNGLRNQPKYTPEKMLKMFYKYKEHCKENNLLINVAGFALYSGFHKDTYYNYKSNLKGYEDIMATIEDEMLDGVIQLGCNAKNPAFQIFYLKNCFGWRDHNEEGRDTLIIMDSGERQAKIEELLRRKQLSGQKVVNTPYEIVAVEEEVTEV